MIFYRSISVENLALLVARAREDRMLVNALMSFALQISEIRERWFRYLSSEVGKKSLAAKLKMFSTSDRLFAWDACLQGLLQ